MTSLSPNTLFFEKKAQELLRLLDKKNSYCKVHFVRNAEMENIRKKLIKLPQFQGKEAVKIKKEDCINVLSFKEPAFPHPESKKRLLGEIYINKDWSAPLHTANCHTSRHVMEASSKEEQLRLLVHGILHLLGYVHNTKRATMKMEAKERKLFKLLWVVRR